MRFKIVDPNGAVSFVAPCHELKMIAAACSKNPRDLHELLEYTRDLDPHIKRRVVQALAVFDEHNTSDDRDMIHQALDSSRPEETPAFRIVDSKTRDASLTPVKAGLVIFNLVAKRIVQVQNSYANLQRQDRGRVRENGRPTRGFYRYRLPEEWQLVP